MSNIDWSKAGTRIRHTPTDAFGYNPDWDTANQRWKDEADYAGEALSPDQVVAMVDCPLCPAKVDDPCRDARENIMDHPHAKRIRAAGQLAVELDLKP